MHKDMQVAKSSRRIRYLVWLAGIVSAGAAVLRWLAPETRSWLPPTLAAFAPSGPLSPARRLAGFGVELLPLAAAVYALAALHRICTAYAGGDLFGEQIGTHYRSFGIGLFLLGIGNGLYTAMMPTVLTFVPGSTRLAIPLGLSSADLYLLIVGGAVMLVGGVMGEAHRIHQDNSEIV